MYIYILYMYICFLYISTQVDLDWMTWISRSTGAAPLHMHTYTLHAQTLEHMPSKPCLSRGRLCHGARETTELAK